MIAARGQRLNIALVLPAQSVLLVIVALWGAKQRPGEEIGRVFALRLPRMKHVLAVILLSPPLLIVNAAISTPMYRLFYGPQAMDEPSSFFGNGEPAASDPTEAARVGTDQSQHRQRHSADTASPSNNRFHRTPAFRERLANRLLQLIDLPWGWIVVIGCLLPGVGEELFFRGYIGRGLMNTRCTPLPIDTAMNSR